MNKSQLIDAVAERTELSKKDSDAVVNAFIETVGDTIKAGDKVTLVGFGSFEAKERAARVGRNPQTGAEIQIAASRVPSFKAGKALKDSVNG
ncbi:MAG: HU family DNA-binding protein [Oscillospiraceae bacterium]